MSQKRILPTLSEGNKEDKEEDEFIQNSLSGGATITPTGERVLHMEGEMEKKSPAHNLWQGRWFKLMTKQRESVSGTFCVLEITSSSLNN